MSSFLESKWSDLEEQKEQFIHSLILKKLQTQQQWCDVWVKRNCFPFPVASVKELRKDTGQDGLLRWLLRKKKKV